MTTQHTADIINQLGALLYAVVDSRLIDIYAMSMFVYVDIKKKKKTGKTRVRVAKKQQTTSNSIDLIGSSSCKLFYHLTDDEHSTNAFYSLIAIKM